MAVDMVHAKSFHSFHFIPPITRRRSSSQLNFMDFCPTTVDGRHPAPVDRWFIPLQGSIHRQVVVWEFWTINYVCHINFFAHFLFCRSLQVIAMNSAISCCSQLSEWQQAMRCLDFSHVKWVECFRQRDPILSMGTVYSPSMNGWFLWVFHVGKYTVRHLDPMGLRFVSGCDQWWLKCPLHNVDGSK